jgi:hypothetical protein
MENLESKADFLKNDYAKLLATLNANTKPLWGKMNVQQMIEHMGDYVRVASGKDNLGLVTAEALLPKAKTFLESEKQFRENTPNALMPDIPAPSAMTKENAVSRLQIEMDDFFAAFDKEPGKTTLNPFFGELTFEQNIQLLHKHGTHHLRQFGINV